MSASCRSRSPGSCATRAARSCACSTLAAAVGLLGAMVLFVGHSLRTMTASAVRTVPLDWQGPVASDRGRPSRRRARRAAARRRQAAAAATAPFAGATTRRAARDDPRRSGLDPRGPAGYLAHIHTFRFLRGTLRPGEIVLDQQLAATLQARLGDR